MDEPADLTDPRTWLQVAETKLEHAHRIFEAGLYDDVISRAYYAMFYAAKGALLTEGLDLRKHSSVVAKFREIFVVTGRIEADYLRYLGRVQSARERSDYAPFMPAGREDAAEVLTAAGAFIARMTKVVEQHLSKTEE
jgi:uncharacterized protein (UPF0332 family)